MENILRIKRTIINSAYIVIIAIAATVIISFIQYIFLISREKDSLSVIAKRIKEDISVKGESWDVSLYNSDDTVSTSNPLYIITTEGYIVDRKKPVRGLLDLSRFTLISQYTEPTSINTVTGETWRALSLPVVSNNYPIAVILVTYYEPADENLEVIDSKLKEVVKTVNSQLSVAGDHIDISKIDARYVPFEIGFQVVNRFNKVLYQSEGPNSVSRMPTYIDRSYIDNQLRSPEYKEVTDSLTGGKYLTLTTSIINDSSVPAGVIVNGVSIDYIYTTLKSSLVLGLLVNGLTIMGIWAFSQRALWKVRRDWDLSFRTRSIPKKVNFMKKDCKLIIDDVVIEIPYASHQYYFCQAIFHKPRKKWEVDELLEVMGEENGPEKWRKIYDTMVALNKKSAHAIDRLFVVRDKRYSANEKIVTKMKLIT